MIFFLAIFKTDMLGIKAVAILALSSFVFVKANDDDFR